MELYIILNDIISNTSYVLSIYFVYYTYCLTSYILFQIYWNMNYKSYVGKFNCKDYKWVLKLAFKVIFKMIFFFNVWPKCMWLGNRNMINACLLMVCSIPVDNVWLLGLYMYPFLFCQNVNVEYVPSFWETVMSWTRVTTLFLVHRWLVTRQNVFPYQISHHFPVALLISLTFISAGLPISFSFYLFSSWICMKHLLLNVEHSTINHLQGVIHCNQIVRDMKKKQYCEVYTNHLIWRYYWLA